MTSLDPGALEVVLDASALLALAQDEPGASTVVDVVHRSAINATNWSEFVQKTLRHADDGPLRVAQVRSLGLLVDAVTPSDGERAAELWFGAEHLSLADRCCIATAERLELPVLTADRSWSGVEVGVEVRLIR